MAIIRKDQKAEGQGLPSPLVALVREAATFKATADFFSVLYEGKDKDKASKEASAKGRLQAYLERQDCPVTVSVGAGGGIKVPDVGGLSFSQPERLDNQAAVAKIIAALKDGSLQPDALAEVISTVNKDGFLKALPGNDEMVAADPDKLVVTLRIANDFRAQVCEALETQVAAAKAAPAAEVTVVQPTVCAGNRPEDASGAPKKLRVKRHSTQVTHAAS
jgi:hypothetical protein